MPCAASQSPNFFFEAAYFRLHCLRHDGECFGIDANARAFDLRQTLQVDYRLACRFLDGQDFYEGVRAALTDKDNAPRWQPARLDDVTPAMVEDYFASMGAQEMVLPTREEMQAARV